MKEKNQLKGFTLIELLAVITILGLFALITTPIFIKLINGSKKSAFENSTYGLVEAAKVYYSNEMMENNGYFTPTKFTVQGGKLTNGTNELPYKGKTPVGDSWVYIDKGGKISLSITDGTYFAVKDVTETGVEVTETEGGNVSRDELAARIESLETKYQDLLDKTNELETSAAISTKVDNLTNKDSKNNIFLMTYPVGSIYICTSDTNPSNIFGGTWKEYGEGRTLVGVGSGTDSNSTTKSFTVDSTGGEYNQTLSISQIPSHTHTFTGSVTTTSAASVSHTHSIPVLSGTAASKSLTGTLSNAAVQSASQGISYTGIVKARFTSGETVGYSTTSKANSSTYNDSVTIDATHSHTVSTVANTTGEASTTSHSHSFTASGSNGSVGGGTSHNNIQPYIAVYMWKRVK